MNNVEKFKKDIINKFSSDIEVGDYVEVINGGIWTNRKGYVTEIITSYVETQGDIKHYHVKMDNTKLLESYFRINLKKINKNNEHVKENKEMRNETLERWYEKNQDAINLALVETVDTLIKEDPLVKRVNADIDVINTYLKEELNTEDDAITVRAELITTDETDDKALEWNEAAINWLEDLNEKRKDVYSLLSMCNKESSFDYDTFDILKAQDIIDNSLNIIVKDYREMFL